MWIQKVILSESNRIKQRSLLYVVIIPCNFLSINPFLIAPQKQSSPPGGYQFHRALDTLCQKLNFEIEATCFISFENLSKIVKCLWPNSSGVPHLCERETSNVVFSAIKSKGKKKSAHINNCWPLDNKCRAKFKNWKSRFKENNSQVTQYPIIVYKKYHSESISENWIS